MYTMREIQVVFARCKDYLELEKACDAFLAVVKDGGFSILEENYLRTQSIIRFRQLKV